MARAKIEWLGDPDHDHAKIKVEENENSDVLRMILDVGYRREVAKPYALYTLNDEVGVMTVVQFCDDRSPCPHKVHFGQWRIGVTEDQAWSFLRTELAKIEATDEQLKAVFGE